MRQLGEQWIVEIEGVRHMVKLCQSNPKEIGTCGGCIYHSWDEGDWCDVAPLKACVEFGYIVKDLGPVNEDGCLAEERTGLFPEISPIILYYLGKEEIIGYEVYLTLEKEDAIFDVCVKARTEQEAKDAWNRRAM